MSQTLRLFIASSIPEPNNTPLIQLANVLAPNSDTRSKHTNIRWTPPTQWHLTWHFLGNTPEAQVPALKVALSASLSSQTAVLAEWHEAAWWPSKSRPQVLVYRLQSNPLIQEISANIHQAMADFTLEPNSKTSEPKAFKPHVTLARIKQRRGSAHRHALPDLPMVPAEIPPWQIDAVTLYSSELTATGAIHHPLHTVRLRG